MHAGARIGDYEIVDEIGRGGMGRVYRVRNLISDRLEAMKVLLPSLIDEGDLAARFQREIRVLAALDHPNIAALRTAFRAGDELVMIMELIDGESLAQRVRRGAMPVPEAVACIDQVLDALAYAHAQGVVHRDVKPGNMMLTPDGVVKLTDFGIARSHADQTVTATGVTTGSLAYMSPEQVNGSRAEPRSDLYSVGISLYELVAGRPPFRAESNVALMMAHLQEAPSPPVEIQPALSPSLNGLILRAIAKSPDDRFQSAADFRAALRAAMSEGSHRPAATPVAAVGAAAAAASTVLVPDRATPVPAPPARPDTPAARLPAPAMAAASVASRQAVTPGAGRRRDWLAFILIGAIAMAGLAAAGQYLWRPDAGGETPAGSTPMPGSPPAAGGDPPVPPEPATSGEDPPGAAASVPAAAPPDIGATEARPTAPAPAAASPVAAGQTRPTDEAVAAPGVTATAPLPPVLAPAQDTIDLDRLETDVDRLLVRAGAVEQSLDVLVQEQARQGVGLRADMTARRLSMDLNLARAQDALARGDAARARQYRDLAAADVQALERFLGR